jgi:lipoprotein-releasing system permease protein
MSFEFFLAKRFLAGQRFGIFRLVTTLIAISGTALGVAALLVTLAVLDGFRTDIQEKILGTQPHIVVVNAFGGSIRPEPALEDEMRRLKHVNAVAPYVLAQALVQTERRVTGVLLRGVDFEAERKVTRLQEILIDGAWNLDAGGVVVGKELALSIGARIGEPLTLVAPQPRAASWNQTPRMRRFTVRGIFRSGMYEYDANLLYVSRSAAQELLGLDGLITGYGARLDDIDAALPVVQEIQQRVSDGLWPRSWQDLNRPLFSAMKLERTVMFIILTLIILVSSFTIISNLLLLTIEKAREIGILQALGASPRQIGRIFLWNGLLLGGTGVGLGLLLGIGLSWILKTYPVIRLPPDIYYVDKLPVRLTPQMIESVALCAFLLVLVSILYPARKAQQMDPVQAIRHG